MAIYFSLRAIFNKDTDEIGENWNSYIAWRKLTHLSEIVSLDCLLNKNLIRVESYDLEDWAHAVIYDNQITGLFKALDPILKKAATQVIFNLLAVEIEPEDACENKELEGFEFVGYDLMDKFFDISSLTSCDGFIDAYSQADVNAYGLIADWKNAYQIQKKLLENNPEHRHSETNVVAIWRHKTIGR